MRDDVLVAAAMAGSLRVEPQVMPVCGVERGQPATHGDILVAVELEVFVKSADDVDQVSGQDIATSHGVGEVVGTDGPVPLGPPPRSLGEGVAYEIPPVEVMRTAEVTQSRVQGRYSDVGVIVSLHEVVKVKVLVCPHQRGEHLGCQVRVGLFVV